MRKVLAAGLVVLMGSMGALALPWGEFRIPPSFVDVARLSLAYRYSDDAATPLIDANSGRLAARYGFWADATHLSGAAAAGVSFALAGFAPTAWLGRAAGAAGFYPWEAGAAHGYAALEFLTATGLPSPGLEARVGLGLGRMRDVTPLAKAARIGRALDALGTAPGGLPGDLLAAVAARLGRASEYASRDELLSEIDAVLEFAAGVPLPASALSAVEEIAFSTDGGRVRGFVFAAGVGFELLDPHGRGQEPVANVTADWAWQSGPDDQLLVRVSGSAALGDLTETTFVASGSFEFEFVPGGTLQVGVESLRVGAPGAPARWASEATLALTFALGRGGLGLQVAAARRSGDPGWSLDVSLAATLHLL